MKVTGKCFKCRGPATEMFGHGPLDFIHGCAQPICERCLLIIQIEHARERAAALPELERRLAALEG